MRWLRWLHVRVRDLACFKLGRKSDTDAARYRARSFSTLRAITYSMWSAGTRLGAHRKRR